MAFNGFNTSDEAVEVAEENAAVGHTAIVYKLDGRYYPFQVLIQQEDNWNPGEDKIITLPNQAPFEAFIVGRKQVAGHWAIRDRLS